MITFLSLFHYVLVFLNTVSILSAVQKHTGDLGQELSRLQSNYVIKQKNQPKIILCILFKRRTFRVKTEMAKMGVSDILWMFCIGSVPPNIGCS